MDDASDEVYSYVLCSICPMKLTKPGLGFDDDLGEIHTLRQIFAVELPDTGFLFPAFNDRSSDDSAVLYSCKRTDLLQDRFLENVLGVSTTLPAKQQKEGFTEFVADVLGEETSFETVLSIQENLCETIKNKKNEAEGETVFLDKHAVRNVFESSGVSQEKLEKYGIFTMGDIARCSVAPYGSPRSEELFYDLLGINAELLIDHAWGWEPCTIKEIKAYRPAENSLSSGQVLQSPYTFSKARVVVAEMAESAALTLVEKKLVTNQLVLTINYDAESLIRNENYDGDTTTDFYGRIVPKESHGTANLNKRSSSTKEITNAILQLYDTIVNPTLLIRRITITTNHVISELAEQRKRQLELFPDSEDDATSDKKEREMQETILSIKKRFGKNAILKGLNFKEGATAKERNEQIGGHKA